MARIGKCPRCGAELYGSEIEWDTITEVKCIRCGYTNKTRIVPKGDREAIKEFAKLINGKIV